MSKVCCDKYKKLIKKINEKKQLLNRMKQQEEREMKLMKEKTKEMKLNLPIEIEQMEEITQMRMNEIIFDSECCDCFENSLIEKYVLYKDNLMIMIDVDDNLKIGCFIHHKFV